MRMHIYIAYKMIVVAQKIQKKFNLIKKHKSNCMKRNAISHIVYIVWWPGNTHS